MVKSDVLEMLKNRTIDVEFIKRDGDLRVMTCTLVESKVPPTNTHMENDEFCAVFDLHHQDWRRFRWDSVLTVNGEKFGE